MYKEDFIREQISAIFKKMAGKSWRERERSYSKTFDLNAYYSSLPRFNPVYVESIRQHERIEVHASSDCFPYEILRSKAPNQDEAEWEYQKGLWDPCTNTEWNKAKNKTKCIANKQNYTISGWDEEQKKYFFEDYPAYHSLPDYFFDIVRDRKCDYPNQLLVIRPMAIPMKYGPEGPVPDQSAYVDFIADIVEEEDIILFQEGQYAVVLTSDEVELSDGTKGYSFDFYDRETIWKITQTGYNEKGATFTIDLHYTHDWGWLPCRKLGGKPKTEDGYIYYESHFSDAVSELNDVIRMNSMLQMAEYSHCFPKFYQVVDKCNHVEGGQACSNGKIWTANGNVDCPSCKGTGMTGGVSPTGMMKIQATNGTLGSVNQLPISPPMGYVEPNGNTLSHLDQRIKDKKKGAFSFLFNTNAEVQKTATEAELDNDDWKAFILQFSNELFALMQFTIEAIGFMRFGKDFVMPSISPPQHFKFRTAASITDELKAARENNMPEPYIRGLILEAAQTRFNDDQMAEDYAKTVFYIDRLWAKSEMEVRTMIGSTCTSPEAIVHSSITSLIDRCVINNDKFWELDLPERKDAVFALADEIANSLKPAGTSMAADIMAATAGGGQ